ncbi:Rer1 family-domain-containing protein [Boletus reticuloceps]|uniref:Rer1 family-domain-containing protein n=1 Tax=Boletus reticuloceps TaxID=495285 RepID=A0A8I2Z1V5_9AGAM|nr:Rer1 family-domain-containing protein [Boletus reticuloceps]
MMSSDDPASTPLQTLQASISNVQRQYQQTLDRWTPHILQRWLATLGLLALFMLRIVFSQGWYIVCYGLAIYLLNLLLAFLQPKFDPSLQDDLLADEIEEGATDSGPTLPSQRDDEFRPFVRRLPEWQFWLSATRSVIVSLLCTSSDMFDVPVYWPILVVYFCVLFLLTMRRQIQHMIKYKYIPFDIGRKARYGGTVVMHLKFASALVLVIVHDGNGQSIPACSARDGKPYLQLPESHRARLSTRSHQPPLFVGVQGPQGSGKTFLTSRLRALLADPPYSLSVAVLSIDDLYLSHAGLTALAVAHPRNRLLHGRGQPGTHDVVLGCTIMSALKAINDGSRTGDDQGTGAGTDVGMGQVALPVFDKSLYDGAGDRALNTRAVRAPIDVVVLEGWCVGFYPVTRAEVEARWEGRGVPELDSLTGECGFDMREYVGLEDVLEVNALLQAYVEWWQALDAFIQIRGPSLAVVYRWRLQQEQEMKVKNGGRGMTDAEVKTFVDRYIPGYAFFGDGVRKGALDEQGEWTAPPWHGQGLVLDLDLGRQLAGTSRF